MKILGIVVVVLVVIVAAVLTFALTLPAEFSAQDNALISAPPESLYARFATPRTWARWSAWTTRSDPTLAYTYSGPDSGLGATMHWTSQKLGSGQLQIVEAVPGRLVHYELHFMTSPAPIVGRVRLEPKAGGTEVTWSDQGSLGGNVVMRLMYPLMKTMMRKAYQESFANLRAETHDGTVAQPKP
ncbi:MAG TPA: SRPBCC family protein [Terriglobales bacterium]|nr:SRPBCC family protein [Terriglobales bacterium]